QRAEGARARRACEEGRGEESPRQEDCSEDPGQEKPPEEGRTTTAGATRRGIGVSPSWRQNLGAISAASCLALNETSFWLVCTVTTVVPFANVRAQSVAASGP